MSIFQLPPSRCPCKEFLISWFLPPNNLGGKKSVKFFWKCKFRVYNAVSSLGIGVRKRVTRYNWHGIKPHAVSICHFSQKAKNQLHARCHMSNHKKNYKCVRLSFSHKYNVSGFKAWTRSHTMRCKCHLSLWWYHYPPSQLHHLLHWRICQNDLLVWHPDIIYKIHQKNF